MGDTQQPQPAGTGATGAGAAAAELAEIQRRQEQVIKAVLVPGWYWWVIAAAIVATVIPLAALVMAVLTGAMIPELRRRVKAHTPQTSGRAAAAIIGMIVLVDGVIVGTAASLHTSGFHPGTIGCAAGAAVLVIAGPLVNRYLRKLMLSQARQQISGAPQAGGTP